jgi:outer membrane receptor protein involved in Fe transport
VATGNLPTLAFRGQTNPNGDADFSSLLPGTQLADPFNGNAPFTGNIIPRARLSSVALALQNNYYPAPNRGNPTDYIGNFQFLAKSPEHLDREDIRIDHHFSDRDSISGRFTYQDDPQPFNYDTNTPIFYHSRGTNVTNTYISETHSFTSVMVNEFRVGYSRDRRFFNPSHDGNAVLQQIGLNLAVPVQAGTKGFPNIGFTPTSSNGGVDGFFERGSSIELAQEYSLLDNVTWQKGTHTIEAGIQVRNGRPQNSAGNFADQFGQFTFTGFATGFPYADFLLGVPFSELQNTDIPNVYIRKTDTGLFAQDSWHATSKLTLNYGLRWEYYKPPTDVNGRRVNFDPATGNIVVANQKTLSLLNPTLPTVLVNNVEVGKYPGGRSLLSGRKTNFGPRLGFAYLLPKGTVVRGGYGIYFGPLTQAVQDSLQNSGLFGTYLAAPQNSFTSNVPAFQFPSPFAAITTGGGSMCTTGCGIVVAGTDPHLKTPTAQEWNFTVERDLGRSMVARVGYRGFMLTQLPVIDNLIIPPVPTGPQLYPFYGGVNWTHDGAIQKMNALDLTLERKFTHGLTFGFSYTLTKNTSDVTDGESGSASNPYNRAADMGNVWYVPRHRLVNNLVWDIPIGRGQRFASGIPRGLDYVVGGWETTIINVFQSGDLLTPVWNGDGSIISNEGVSLRPNCNGSLSSPHKSRQEWFNTAAFSAPAPGTYGNCGVGIIEGPGLIGFSFGLHKAF